MNKSWQKILRTFLSGLPVLLFAGAPVGPVYAVVADSAPPPIFDTAYLFQVFGSLLLVFGCLFGLAFLLRKFNGLPMNDRKLIQVIGSAKVGSREKIVLLKAGEVELLVGVAAGSVRTLHVFGEGENSLQNPTESPGGDFANVLSNSFKSAGEAAS